MYARAVRHALPNPVGIALILVAVTGPDSAGRAVTALRHAQKLNSASTRKTFAASPLAKYAAIAIVPFPST